MKEFLNEMFLDKGLEFLDIIITEVLLPNEIMGPLDRKAQYASLNEMEREKYNYQMRLIDDDETLQLLKQRKTEQRDSLNEEFSKKITLTSRELSIVKANAKKSVAEIKATATADQA
jgi:maltodextrin utilization protein YvdJ